MLRIATFNVNGIRACVRRGFREWLEATDPDIVALQEVRCPEDALPRDAFDGWQLSYDAGTRAGRNGVAVLTRERPSAVRLGIRLREFADEGRYVEVDLAGTASAPPLTVASLYLPKGGTPTDGPASLARYERKMRFLGRLRHHLTGARRDAARRGAEFLVMGDFNIAHTELDLLNWRTNRRSEGFLPEERAWFGSVLGSRTLHDVVRRLHPDRPGPYSWWSWRGQSWTNDAGWRIDYQLASAGLARAAVGGGTHRADSYETRMSDHAPVVVDYAFA